MQVQLQSFLTLALDAGKSSALTPHYFNHREISGTLTRRLGGIQSQSVYFKQKNLLPLLGFKPPIIPSIAQSLYRLSYQGSTMYNSMVKVIPLYITWACGVSGGTAPLRLNLSTWQRWSASSPSHFTASKQGIGQGPGPVWAVWRKEKSLAPIRI